MSRRARVDRRRVGKIGEGESSHRSGERIGRRSGSEGSRRNRGVNEATSASTKSARRTKSETQNFAPLAVSAASALPERSTDLRFELRYPSAACMNEERDETNLGMSRNVSDFLTTVRVLTSVMQPRQSTIREDRGSCEPRAVATRTLFLPISTEFSLEMKIYQLQLVQSNGRDRPCTVRACGYSRTVLEHQ